MKTINITLISLLLSFSFASGVQAACCSGHGGPSPCTKASGPQMCQDGTESPSCTCTKEMKLKAQDEKKAAKQAEKEAKKAEKAKASKKLEKVEKKARDDKEDEQVRYNKKVEKTSKASGKLKAVPNHSENSKGCCSHHGGLAHKCSASKKQICADGTESESCPCTN